MNSLGKKVVKNMLVVVGSISGLAAISTAFKYLMSSIFPRKEP